MLNAIQPPHKSLSELEHQIMEILWAHGPATSDQVRNALAAKRPLKDSTIRTILRRLREKGYVRHKVEGRTFVYMGVEAPRNLAVRAVRQIIDRFCEGSVEQLLVGMVEDEMVNRRELQHLVQKIAPRKGTKGHA